MLLVFIEEKKVWKLMLVGSWASVAYSAWVASLCPICIASITWFAIARCSWNFTAWWSWCQVCERCERPVLEIAGWMLQVDGAQRTGCFMHGALLVFPWSNIARLPLRVECGWCRWSRTSWSQEGGLTWSWSCDVQHFCWRCPWDRNFGRWWTCSVTVVVWTPSMHTWYVGQACLFPLTVI